MFETRVSEGVMQISGPAEIRWLSTGWDGGFSRGGAVYNISVPTGFDRTDLDRYVDERLEAAGFAETGPTLLTGVDLENAVGASLGPVTVVATVGLSNPAGLPLDPDGTVPEELVEDASGDPGTVNLVVGVARALDDGGIATLLSVVAEAKAATVQGATGFTGTTSDAVVVGSDQTGERRRFAGSATNLGDAARASVRDAILEGIGRRYADTQIPGSVGDADSGIETTRRAAVFEP